MLLQQIIINTLYPSKIHHKCKNNYFSICRIHTFFQHIYSDCITHVSMLNFVIFHWFGPVFNHFTLSHSFMLLKILLAVTWRPLSCSINIFRQEVMSAQNLNLSLLPVHKKVLYPVGRWTLSNAWSLTVYSCEIKSGMYDTQISI